MTTTIRGRGGALLTLGGGLLAFVLLFPGVLSGSLGQSATADVQSDLSQQACAMTPFALDPADPTKPNPAKEVEGAFGPSVTARGEEPVKAELKERRSCGADGVYDTYLTAAHYSEWSHYGLTSVTVGDSTAEINAFAARIKADPALYKTTLAELEKLEGESTYSEAAVAAGIWSLYMIPDGNGGVVIKVGQTSFAGTNAVFTHGDVQIRYRLDCGFQPNREGGFPGIDVCEGTQCAPPPVCPEGTTGTWPDCYVPCPPGYTGERQPDCYYNKWQTPTTTEPGWDQRGTDNGVTNGQQSADQINSGDTRGNAGTDQTNVGTSGTTGQDTSNSNTGGPVAEDATKGGDDQTKGEVDTDNTVSDPKGTEGATCQPNPALGITCPAG